MNDVSAVTATSRRWEADGPCREQQNCAERPNGWRKLPQKSTTRFTRTVLRSIEEKELLTDDSEIEDGEREAEQRCYGIECAQHLTKRSSVDRLAPNDCRKPNLLTECEMDSDSQK